MERNIQGARSAPKQNVAMLKADDRNKIKIRTPKATDPLKTLPPPYDSYVFNPVVDGGILRVRVENADVGELINSASRKYDAILLDVDNGPEGLTHPENDQLYSFQGLQNAYHALRESGVLAVWSATPAPRFKSRLRKVGFTVDERRVRAHRGKGSRHVIWLATRGK